MVILSLRIGFVFHLIEKIYHSSEFYPVNFICFLFYADFCAVTEWMKSVANQQLAQI